MYGNGKTMCAMTNNEQLEKLIQAAKQMADDDPRLTKTRAMSWRRSSRTSQTLCSGRTTKVACRSQI
jgi:hypothetical protein